MTELFEKQLGANPDVFLTRGPYAGRKIVWTSVQFKMGQKPETLEHLLAKMFSDMLLRYKPVGEITVVATRRIPSEDGLLHVYQAAFEISGAPNQASLQ